MHSEGLSEDWQQIKEDSGMGVEVAAQSFMVRCKAL
jgi:thiamine monophosphate kinase